MSLGGNNDGGGSGCTSVDKKRIHSPPVELPSSNAQNFFEEAKITQAEENELKRKFGKFCTKSPSVDGGEEEVYLTLDNFCTMLQYYECASAQHYEAYFHAIDRNKDDKLDFQEFFLGCCAADPSTVHILNSFTGYERSQYIFDFYDTNRSSTLEFDEFARLTADCLSLPNTNASEEQTIKTQAVEKARDLGALEESGPGLIHFSCIKFKKFYEFIQNERLRGTSRLFRFYKSIIKSRGSHHSRRAQGSGISGSGSTGHTPGGQAAGEEEDPPSDREDCEWHAHLLDLDAVFDPEGCEPPALAWRQQERPGPSAYLALPPPAPAPALRLEQELTSATEARGIARKVMRALCAQPPDGLLPFGPGGPGAAESDLPFVLVTPAQLRSLCNAAVRLLELEDMVLTGLQPPIKVFGALHGQLLDLLSHFRWHQAPLEDVGDILYTTYVFTGDYADRGSYSLEVLTLLLSLKVAHPHRVTLLRGHHENRHVNYHLGLRLECERRLGAAEGLKVFEQLNRTFEYMSLGAVVGGQMLVLGPSALPPSLTRLEQLRRYKKPLTLPHAMQLRSAQPVDRLNDQVLLELFTPGPLLPRELGSGREAAPEQLKGFCAQHRLAAVVRSRQIPATGFAFECGGRLITVASCMNYCDAPGGNDAAILCITKEEGSANLQVRPKVLTARVAKLYGVLGRGGKGRDQGPLPLPTRWPVQPRASTPGRQGCSSRPSGGDSDTGSVGDATALVIAPDRSIMADSSLPLAVFPVFGPDRPFGTLAFRGRGGSVTASPVAAAGRGSGDSPRLGTRTSGADLRDVQAFASSVNTNEDWALLGGARDRSGPRGSLGPRRNSASATGKGPGQGESDTTVPTPKGAASPARGAPPRTPGGGASAAVAAASPGGSSSIAPAQRTSGPGAAEGALGTAAHRRGAVSPSAEGSRLSLGGAPGTGGTSSGAAPLLSGYSGSVRDPRTATAGRNGGSNGKPKEHRGPSRPPATTAPSPKSTPAGARGGAARRTGGEAARGEAAPGVSLPASPRQSSAAIGDETRAPARSGDVEDRFCQAFPAEPQALSRLLVDSSPRLACSSLPPAPTHFLQAPRAAEQPLLWHLCRLWVEAGLGDREWAQALHMFDAELGDQPRQQTKGGLGPPAATAEAAGEAEDELREVRWTLETFSMWLLKRGRRLRECSQWFRAFDFDQDEMVSVADFLQGLVAAAAPRLPPPGSSGGLCAGLAIFRLLDLEKRPSLDVRDLEGILSDAQVSLGGSEASLSLPQVAQQVTDFEFFRSALLPRLQSSSTFRLRVFGGGSAES